MSDFDKYLQYRALHRKFTRVERFDPDEEASAAYEEYQAEQDDLEEEWRATVEPDEYRNICFKESPEFAARLTNTCNALDIKKRDFLRRAIDDALSRAEEHINDVLEDDK